MRRRVSRTSDRDEATRTGSQRSLLGSRIPLAALVQAMAVAEHLNIRHAATALGMNQSSVSLKIKQLEENLGILLFERRPRGVRLTDAGSHFIEHVSVGFEHLHHAVKTAGAIAHGEQGRLRLGLYSPIAAGFLGELLHQFHKLHPAVALEIAEGRARDTIRAVREDRLDVTFVLGVPTVEDCHAKPLWTENLVIAMPRHHRLASRETVRWTDMAEEKFVVRREGSGPQLYDHIVLRLAEQWREPHIERSEVGRDTLMTMVAQEYGITLTSEAIMQISFPGVVFRYIADEPEPMTFSAVWSPHNRSQALRDLLDLAQRKARAKRIRIASALSVAPSQTPDPSP